MSGSRRPAERLSSSAAERSTHSGSRIVRHVALAILAFTMGAFAAGIGSILFLSRKHDTVVSDGAHNSRARPRQPTAEPGHENRNHENPVGGDRRERRGRVDPRGGADLDRNADEAIARERDSLGMSRSVAFGGASEQSEGGAATEREWSIQPVRDRKVGHKIGSPGPATSSPVTASLGRPRNVEPRAPHFSGSFADARVRDRPRDFRQEEANAHPDERSPHNARALSGDALDHADPPAKPRKQATRSLGVSAEPVAKRREIETVIVDEPEYRARRRLRRQSPESRVDHRRRLRGSLPSRVRRARPPYHRDMEIIEGPGAADVVHVVVPRYPRRR